MNEWQSIKTAPKDGTWILCYIKGKPQPYLVCKWWGNFWSDSACSGWWDKSIQGWMPLSKPPTKEHCCYSDNNEFKCVTNSFGHLYLCNSDDSMIIRIKHCAFCGEKE